MKYCGCAEHSNHSNRVMKYLNSFVAIVSLSVLFGGCATPIDLYQYKEITSVSIIDENKEAYQIRKPTILPVIHVDEGRWKGFGEIIQDQFLIQNDTQRIFQIDQKSDSSLTLKLQNFEVSRTFFPSEFIQTDRGGYYTDPYWSYTVASVITAEIGSPQQKHYFEALDRFVYTETGLMAVPLRREYILQAMQNGIKKLIRQMANQMTAEGFVISKRVSIKDPEDVIFMINLGSEHGLYPGQTVKIYKEQISKNESNAKTLIEKVYIGNATVSNLISPKDAWIQMDDDEKNTIIKMGDNARPEFR